jgi:hypothetical protein
MKRVLPALLLVIGLILTGCAAPGPEPSPSSAEPSASATPASSPPASTSPLVTVTLGELAGEAPAVSDIEDPWGNGTSVGTRFDWEGISVSLFDGFASVWVRSPRVGEARVQTAEGVAVGSTRAQALAAGAWDSWDEEGDGVAEWLGIGSREAPGTSSLRDPGSVGIEYVLLKVEGDVVTEIQAPANDFSDL